VSLWPFLRPDAAAKQLLADRYAAALDGKRLADGLAAAGVSSQDQLSESDLSVHGRAFKKDRFLVLAQSRGASVAVKGYADDRGRRVFRDHVHAWEAGLDGRFPETATPRPIADLPGLGAHASAWLFGRGARPGSFDDAHQSGQALARLHSLPVAFERSLDVEVMIANSWRYARLLERTDADLGHAACTLVMRGEAAFRERSVDWVPVHGDFWLDAVLFTASGPILLDWDQACRFDPAWDLALFLVQLERHMEGDERSVAGAFLAGYQDVVGPDSSLAERIACQKCFARVHKAVSALRFDGPAGPRRANRLLSEGRMAAQT
jgi:hypothetical protein